MNTVVIDCKTVKSMDDVHETFRSSLPLPQYYGNNLDALHDVLTDIREYTSIIVLNSGTVPVAAAGKWGAFTAMLKDTAEQNKMIRLFTVGGSD